MIYFKEYTDEIKGAVDALNEDIKNSEDTLISVQYQVVRYGAHLHFSAMERAGE